MTHEEAIALHRLINTGRGDYCNTESENDCRRCKEAEDLMDELSRKVFNSTWIYR